MANNNKHAGPNVPALRFPEFGGEWEKKCLGDISENISSGKTKSTTTGGKYVLIGSTGVIGNTSYADYSGNLILVARVGANAGLINYYSGDCGITDNTLIIKPLEQEKNFCHYVYHYLKHCNLNQFVFGSGQPLITGGMLKRLPIRYGTTDEINKLSSLFDLLDARIEAQSKIIEEQETLLKSLADSLISSQVANMALNDCVVARSSTMKESELENPGPFPVFGASGLCGYSNEALEESDSILVTKDGSGVGTCQYATGAHSFLGTLCSLTAKYGVYLPYVYYALLNFNFASFKTGLAIPHIYFKDYGKAVIYCPAYDEQVRIASGLEKLEAKINTDKELLKQYQLQKEYLLSRMFI